MSTGGQAPVGGGTLTAPLDMQTFGNLIRSWVHYDTMLSGLNKQIKNIRDMRNTFEGQVLQMLTASNTPNPIIQIAGGRVIVGEEKHQTPLSFRNLEEMLHQYYRAKPGARDETADILKFIRQHRQTEITPTLKRVQAASGTTPKG